MTGAKLKICFVIPSLETGGAERQLLYLLKGLAANAELLVVCTRTEGPLAFEARQFAQVRALGLKGGWDPRLRARLKQALGSFRPDIVHSVMFGFDYPVNVAAREMGVPIVISSRRQLAGWKRRRHVWMQRRANRLVDCIVANSDAVADFAAAQEQEARDRYHVIHNGLDLEDFSRSADSTWTHEKLGVPEGRRIVGMVGNFSPVKDHALFVRAAGMLCERRDDLHFLLVGDGPLRPEIEQQIASVGLMDRFTLRYGAGSPAGFYAAMSVAVLCSESEGFPNVVMEAMAASKPVVAARVGGVPELIHDGETGKLIATRHAADFADAIEWYLDHPEAAAETGRAARAFVRDNLGTERMCSAYRGLYDELLSGAQTHQAGA